MIDVLYNTIIGFIVALQCIIQQKCTYLDFYTQISILNHLFQNQVIFIPPRACVNSKNTLYICDIYSGNHIVCHCDIPRSRNPPSNYYRTSSKLLSLIAKSGCHFHFKLHHFALALLNKPDPLPAITFRPFLADPSPPPAMFSLLIKYRHFLLTPKLCPHHFSSLLPNLHLNPQI